MTGIVDFLYKWVAEMGNKIISLLPTSPFRSFIDTWIPPDYLGWLNWFFPVSEILAILGVWLISIGTFYLYSIIMRWVKMIGD